MLPCITSLDETKFEGVDCANKEICTLELTVPTGLEEVAAQECREKLLVHPVVSRGRVLFDVTLSKVPECLKLRAVDNINVILAVEPKFKFSSDRDESFASIYKFADSPDWRKGICIWKSVFHSEIEDPFEGEQPLKDQLCTPRPEVDLRLLKSHSLILGNLPEEIASTLPNINPTQKNESKFESSAKESKKGSDIASEEKDVDKQRKCAGPKFRVTCHRVGSNHSFGSPEAARQFGGGVNEKFGWPVNLKNYELEIMLNIIEDFVYVAVSLTKEALFKRNITHFGPTNLRSTICYNMLQLAKPQPGDFIIDPMCGGSSIPIEGALTYPNCFHLGGDNFETAVTRSKNNIDHLQANGKPMAIDVVHWNVAALPLRDQIVDAVVCDLPFGKRVGNRTDNRVLYFQALVELARVTKVDSGRAVLLTHDKNSMTKNLQRVSSLWKNFSTRTINIGGLAAGIFLLQRTSLLKDSTIVMEISNFVSKKRKRKLSTEDDTEK